MSANNMQTTMAPSRHQMTNSHILVNRFDYVEVTTIEDVIRMMAQYGSRGRVLAGGTQLLVMMKMEREKPEVLINIQKIPGMSHLRIGKEGELAIGACVNIHTIRKNEYIRSVYPALALACASFGSVQIELMATIGGNVCNASPASDTVPALMVYDAELELVSTTGIRRVRVEEFYLGPGKTRLQEGEILKSVILPKPKPDTSGIYLKITRVAADLAKASLAVILTRQGNIIQNCQIALGSVAPTVLRARRVESFLNGKDFSDENCQKAAEMASEDCSPIDDVRSSAWYRRQIIKVMVIDALKQVWHISGDKSDGKIPEQRTFAQGNEMGTRPKITTQTEKRQIDLIVNGKSQRVWVSPNELLLNVLRERLQLTGSKYGCGVGECSACTVHINNQPALACLVLAISLDQYSVDTIEGVQESDGTLHPLQEAFIEHAAFQCGYCTPGLIMSLTGLLKEMPKPDEDDIRDYLKGNRCRCTGYVSIVRAVLDTVNQNQL
jgi:xanthine dehydrogenase iron-sulfur cluster and FAD-binding subunit A